MKTNDVYEQWKKQRSSIEAPSGFESKVMARLGDSDTDGGNSPPSVRRSLDHPVWAIVAVVAATLVGVLRVSFALLIGIL
jgi:hypothetical protein